MQTACNFDLCRAATVAGLESRAPSAGLRDVTLWLAQDCTLSDSLDVSGNPRKPSVSAVFEGRRAATERVKRDGLFDFSELVLETMSQLGQGSHEFWERSIGARARARGAIGQQGMQRRRGCAAMASLLPPTPGTLPLVASWSSWTCTATAGAPSPMTPQASCPT